MFRVFLCIFLSSLQLLFSSVSWIHLELGAGNYGKTGGHNKRNMEQKFDPNIQYKVLFETLDQLIERYGPAGVFQINDIEQAYMEYAVHKLQEYAEIQGYDRLVIEGCPGDYFTINFMPYLNKYGRYKYDSLHLKNPEGTIYRGHKKNAAAFVKNRQEARDKLQKVANYSKEGLYFFTLYHGNFFPEVEKQEFAEQGIFYHETDQWEAVDYYHPNGNSIVDGRVFLIKSQK